ncbi:MAG TPA: hypothetical protein VGW36_02955 [Pyrinomonadaceae bacterium]|nr:hypothetical protein [Pyrinomonadaceae bacterium]
MSRESPKLLVENMNTVSVFQNKETWFQLFFFLAIAAVYLCFPTKSYFFDGIAFAGIIEQTPELGTSLLHPNHLIYNLVGAAFYKLILRMGIEMRAVAALQILNSLLGALSAYVVFGILRTSLTRRYFWYALTLLFAFSATWWKFATDADAYIPSVLFVLISFYLALPKQKPRPLLVAMAYSIALCFHQMAVIFFPVLVIGLFLQGNDLPQRRRVMNALTFSVTAPVLTIAAYIFSFYSMTGTTNLAQLMRWTLSYSPDESFGFNFWDNLGFTVRGHFRLFFGGRLNAIQGLVSPPILILIVLLVLVIAILLVQIIRNFRKPTFKRLRESLQNPARRVLLLLCLLWIAVYVVALFFIAAHHTFYRLFYLPAIVILLGLFLDSNADRIASSYRLALFVVALSLSNFITLIFPYSHVQKYPPLVFALERKHDWPRGTVVYYGRANSDKSLVEYFNPGTIWKELDTDKLDAFETDVREISARGHAVWLETTAIDELSFNPTMTDWLNSHSLKTSTRSLVTNAHNIRFVQVKP